MKITYLLIGLSCLVLAACSDGDADITTPGNGNGGNGGVADLSALVIQQCTKMPENQDPVAINGLGFPDGTNDPNNQAFTNACL